MSGPDAPPAQAEPPRRAARAGGVNLTELLQAAGDLVNPVTAARQLPWAAGELLKIALGRPSIGFDAKDPRFADAAWRANPFYRRLGQSYRLGEEWTNRMVEAGTGPWPRTARARYLGNIVTAALAPTNFFPTNPAAVKRAFDTGGRSVLRGGLNMASDLARGGMPRMVDRTAFEVGGQLARTPGAVVYREELFELLQYAPATPSVRSRPLLMVPPQINRYYVLDLSPGRSMVEFAVQQGIQTFMLVWRNPRAERGHGRWGVEDYLAALDRAARIVREITDSDALNLLGLCAGGITTALYLGHLAARDDRSVSSATFIVTMLTSDYPNVIGMSDTAPFRTALGGLADGGQVIPGEVLRTSFAWLRPNDLVFNYLVSGWLLGENPAPFDVLAWNDDATGLSARLAAQTTDLLTGRRTAQPGAITALGTPIDLRQVSCDSFVVAGYTDHIAPWRVCYSSGRLLGGDQQVLVVKSGHIQSFVNPVRTAKYDYLTGPPAAADPDRWLETAAHHRGSWWPRWAEWLIARSGPERAAPTALGREDYPPLGPAPGTYVRE